MKITGSGIVDVTRLYNENKQKAAGSKQRLSDRSDTVEISREGTEIAKYVSQVKGLSDERIQKINDIKNRIQDGTYNVSSEDLASRILDSIKETE